MKPDLGHTLATGAMTLLGELSPMLGGTYGSGSANTLGAMMMIASIEQERAADNRMKTIHDVQLLFGDVDSHIEGDLQRKVKEGLALKPKTLLISELDRVLNGLKSTLIDVQAHVERQDDAASKTINKQIWIVLGDDAERNLIGLG